MSDGPLSRDAPGETDANVGAVYARVRALRVIAEGFPTEVGDRSGFALDEAVIPASSRLSTFVAAKSLLFEALSAVQAAAATARETRLSARGTHILLLRPGLVSVAKAAWVVRPTDPAERVVRVGRLVAEDGRQGASAMRKFVETGANEQFGAVAAAFERGREEVLRDLHGLSSDVGARPPRDETLIRELGQEIDRYYGSADSTADVQLLWSASSSLAHSERWYAALSRGERAAVAEIVTSRSLDVLCSAVNVTWQRVLYLTATPVQASAKTP